MIATSQQSIMQRMLSGAGSIGVNGSSTNGSASNTMSRNGGIEDIAARLQRQQNGTGSGTNGYANNQADSDTIGINNNTPLMNLTCDDCGIFKTNSEDMEVHIKMEHLNWLPFQCPICLSERASDAQMREHLHSSHKKNMNKFIYVDNVTAKRQLQLMMDRALSNSLIRRASQVNSTGSVHSRASISTPKSTFAQMTSLRQKQQQRQQDQYESYERVSALDISDSPPAEPSPVAFTATSMPRKRPHVEISSGDSNTDALLASISRAARGSSVIEGEVVDDDESISIASLFNNKKVKSEIDHLMELRHPEILGQYPDEPDALNGLNPISVLDDVAALFANTDGRIEESFPVNVSGLEKAGKPLSAKAVSSQVSKKRVLGECSKCNKPVTAGARQMHMFYHLSKDHKINRFRCLFDNCTVEHYRKDQMENHQSKIHGKIDAEMMEDRSLELFQKCQELNHELFVANRSQLSNQLHSNFPLPSSQDLSLELLGTKSGSMPGPTAARAEAAYNAQQASVKSKSGTPGSAKPATSSTPRTDDEHPLECKICHKTMQNRIRGFHILWHMAKDMGINRYICRTCGYGHDRSQSVQTHGKKEHGTEDVVQDRINEYEDEVKEMSMRCFGFQALFAQDNKRRSKIPVTIPSSGSLALQAKKEKAEADAILLLESSQSGSEGASNDGMAEMADDEPEMEPEPEQEQEDEQIEEEEEADEESHSRRSRKRRSGRFARFGIRRPAPKNKRVEMAKLREVSMLIGGAQYYKKKVSETAMCDKCGKVTNSRLSDHAYTHMDSPLFLCPLCESGHPCRDYVARHIRDMHETADRPVDNRLKYAQDIKDTIRDCYPAFFVDAAVPSAQEVEKLKKHLGLLSAATASAGIIDGEEEDEQEPEEDEYKEDVGEEMDTEDDEEKSLRKEDSDGDADEKEAHDS